MDVPTILAIITVASGLYTAYSTRQRSASEVFLAAMDAAKGALEMRDVEINKLNERIEHLVQYITYLSNWVRKYSKGEIKPMTYEEFLIHDNDS